MEYGARLERLGVISEIKKKKNHCSMFLYPCANVASNKPRLQEQFNDVLKNIFQYRQKFQFSQKKVLHALSIFCYEYFPISKACFFFF